MSSASIFSVSIDPMNNSMAVSGGEDDKAYVWRIQDGETLMECHGMAIVHTSIVNFDTSFDYNPSNIFAHAWLV